MNFKITDTKPLNKNTLRGSFTLAVGPMKIEGFTYHEKNGKSWVGFPSRQYVDQESGENKYHPIVRIEEDDRYKKFQTWAKEQVKDIFAQPETEQTGYQDDDDIPF